MLNVTNPLNNLLIDTDSYKDSHGATGAIHAFGQYPPNTTKQYSYIEARSGGKFDKVLFFGLQIYLMQYLSTPITMEMIDQAEEFNNAHGEPFDRQKWEKILSDHNGFLPIEISAIPEGTVVPTGIPLVTVTNTHPDGWWIPSWIETQLQRAVWYPTTVATLSKMAKNVIKKGLETSADNLDGLAFKLHDFGSRGSTSRESAALGGVAHLVNFMGSDTKVANIYAKTFYDEPMASFSLPATEHSSVSAWGDKSELHMFRNFLNQFGPKYKMLACVSDTYNLMNAVDLWTINLREEVRNWGGTIVIRPDSGDPTTIPVQTVQRIHQNVPGRSNRKGFLILPDSYRVIQGDGMNLKSTEVLDNNLIEAGISTDNLARGMGGGLLQLVSRDDARFAQKLSSISIENVSYGVGKNPVTDPTKASKRGEFYVKRLDNGEIVCINIVEATTRLKLNPTDNLLQPVWVNGKLVRKQSFQNIRDLSNL